MNEYVWDRLPIAKHAIGRKRVREMAFMARDLYYRGTPPENISTQMCNSQRYGMGIVAMLVLSAIANQIVRLVLEWLRSKQEGHL